MNSSNITTLELHGHSEAYAISKAIEARMAALQDSTKRDAISEYLTLQQIAVRISPQADVPVKQEQDDTEVRLPALNEYPEEAWLL